jgi:hypothetical protein
MLDGYLRIWERVIIMKHATHLASILLRPVSLAHLLRIAVGA